MLNRDHEATPHPNPITAHVGGKATCHIGKAWGMYNRDSVENFREVQAGKVWGFKACGLCTKRLRKLEAHGVEVEA